MTKNSSHVLELEGVAFSYEKKEADILKGLSFSIPKGRRAALLGPNGSGKSTSFKIISTQLTGWSGNVHVAGHDLRKDPIEVRKKLGVCFQSASLDKILTARENLVLQGRVLGLSRDVIEQEILDLSKTLRVDYLDKRVANLSGGQARRVEIIKAFLGSPALLLLDEPTNGLDPQARRDFWQELSAISDRKGASVLVTTHLIEEAEVCDELVFISDGACVAQGSPRDLRNSLGFEIIYIEVPALQEKMLELKKILQSSEQVHLMGEALRISTQRPAELFELLRKMWSEEIRRIEWAKPTLADVYFEKTGRAFQ